MFYLIVINIFIRKASQEKKPKKKMNQKKNLGAKAKQDTIRKRKVIHIIIMGLNITQKKKRKNTTRKIYKTF